MTDERLQEYQRVILKECSTGAAVTITLRHLLEEETSELRGSIEARDGVISMTVDRLGGRVEGRATHRGNFLQRIDALRQTERELRRLKRAR
jgi:hypothetical protein